MGEFGTIGTVQFLTGSYNPINSSSKVIIFLIKTENNTLSEVKNKDIKNKDKLIPFIDQPLSQKTIDIGNTDLAMPNIFQSSIRHTDVSPEDISERWFISIQQAKDTLKEQHKSSLEVLFYLCLVVIEQIECTTQKP